MLKSVWNWVTECTWQASTAVSLGVRKSVGGLAMRLSNAKTATSNFMKKIIAQLASVWGGLKTTFLGKSTWAKNTCCSLLKKFRWWD